MLVPLTMLISLTQKSFMDGIFKKECEYGENKFVGVEQLEVANKHMVNMSWNKIILLNFSLLLFGGVLSILSYSLITLGVGVMFASLINQFTSFGLFPWLRLSLEKYRERRKQIIWNKDLDNSKKNKTEQYIKDINC